MIKKPVSISKLKSLTCVDEFEWGICTANGHLLATMAQKGRKGLKNAGFIKTAINEYLLNS